MDTSYRTSQDDVSAATPGSAQWTRFLQPHSAADFFQAWLNLLCNTVPGAQAALLVLEESSATFVPAAVWPAPTHDVTYLGDAAQKCLVERKGQSVPDPARQSFFVSYPVEVETRLYGALVLDCRAADDAALLQVARQLHWGMGWLEAFFRKQTHQTHAAFLQRSELALDLVALASEHAKLEDAALAVANELCAQTACQRVGIGLLKRQVTRLVALSHTAFFERKSHFVADIENAMDEALDQRKTIVYPPLADAASGIAIANRDLALAGSVCTVVLRMGGRSVGAMTFERALPNAFSAEDVELFQAAAALLAPILDMKEAQAHWIAGRAAQQLRTVRETLADPRRPAYRVGLVALLALVVFASVFEVDYRVSAKAALEGEVQRAVAAPFDGYVAQAQVRAGQTVTRGQMLARLDDRELLLEQQKWSSELEQGDRKYRDALSKQDRAQARILAAQVAAAEAQLSLVQDKLARASLLAPFDGVVVSGDLSQMLGSPVEQGKLLFEVAPLDAYRVVLKIDDRDMRDVAVGQPGTLMLSGIAGESQPLVVTNIATSEAAEGHNYFRVEAKLVNAPPRLRPGMEGVGKVEVGQRTLIWTWTHRLTDWLRLLLWEWSP